MRLKESWVYWIATLFLLSAFVVGGCNPGTASANAVTGEPDNDNGKLQSAPEMARDATLAFLRLDDQSVPSAEVGWVGENITPEESVAFDHFLYTYQGWSTSVVSPRVPPEQIVYSVVVINTVSGFKWAGLVDAQGEVVQMGSLQFPPLTPTVTPLPTGVSFPTAIAETSTPTLIPIACNDAVFLEDVSVLDGTTFPPGEAFLKEWQVRNVGSCTWTTDYELVFVGGNRLGASAAIPLAETVRPGESVELGAYMFAPQTPGTYRGFWMLRNEQGERFGVGNNANDSFRVEITVVGDVTRHKYDFALDYCDAIWRSAAGRLACGDETTPRNGSVTFLISPDLENRHENEPTLWVHPNEAPGGWIEGTYPGITIRSGDHFRGWVGCLAGYELCNVTFYLAYIGVDNTPHTLGTWQEVYDQEVTVIDIDLGSLAGQNVQFILGMEANTANVSSAQGFWFVPRIQQER